MFNIFIEFDMPLPLLQNIFQNTTDIRFINLREKKQILKTFFHFILCSRNQIILEKITNTLKNAAQVVSAHILICIM